MKLNLWAIGFFLLLGFCIVETYINCNDNLYEKVITRGIIEGIDDLIEYKEQGKIGEAEVLSDALEIGAWYLRNSKDTKFYDDVGYWGMEYKSIEQLKEIQCKLCPKSDLSRKIMEKDGMEEKDIKWRERC